MIEYTVFYYIYPEIGFQYGQNSVNSEKFLVDHLNFTKEDFIKIRKEMNKERVKIMGWFTKRINKYTLSELVRDYDRGKHSHGLIFDGPPVGKETI